MPMSRTVQELLAQKDEVILALKNEIKALKTKIESARGAHIEELVKEWTEGTRMGYKDGHDVTTKNGTCLEVKYSEVRTLENGVKRWNWDSILGQNETKKFHYLVLAGAKDDSYEYPTLPYVFFIVPRDAVNDITRNCLALNTNLDLDRANNHKLRLLKPYLVRSQNEFERFKL